MTINAEDVGKLLTLDDLVKELESTEPLTGVEFNPNGEDPKVRFTYPAGWNTGLKDMPGTEMTEAQFEFEGNTYHLTKDAALQAGSLIGLQRDYVTRTPGPLVADHLNWWMQHTPNKSFKLLESEGYGLAFVKGTVIPISNLGLLERTVEGIRAVYGPSTEILADYKRHHDLRRTDYRLIVPEKQRVMKTARSGSDTWSLGIDMTNSLTAETQSMIRGYLFSWWCTNGATSTHATSGAFNRKGHISEADALEWATSAVDDILGGLEHEFDAVEEMTRIPIEGEVNQTLRDVFHTYKVPVSARQGIIEQLIESDDLTMFGLHAAITEAANRSEFNPNTVARLLEVGGDLPGAVTGRCSTCHRLPVN